MQTQALPPGHKVKFQALSGPVSGSYPNCPPIPVTSPFMGSPSLQAAWMVRKALPESEDYFLSCKKFF